MRSGSSESGAGLAGSALKEALRDRASVLPAPAPRPTPRGASIVCPIPSILASRTVHVSYILYAPGVQA
jgi:hypothetical protein